MNCNKCNIPYSEDEICPQCDGCPDCCDCYSDNSEEDDDLDSDEDI